MTHRAFSSILLSCTALALALGVAGCDGDEVGVHELMMRTDPGGTPEYAGGGCFLVTNGEGSGGGGGGGGPDFAEETLSEGGRINYRYFIAKEGETPEFVTPANGELAAEIDADMEFFASGETKHVSFATYTGIGFEVYLWGEPDCEGELPTEPPESD